MGSRRVIRCLLIGALVSWTSEWLPRVLRTRPPIVEGSFNSPEARGYASGSREVPSAVREGRHRVAQRVCRGSGAEMMSIQPELWVDAPGEALAFYQAAFGATVLHRVGDGDDIVAQLGVGDAAFWVAAASSTMKRLSPRAIDGATSRTLLVVENPDSVVRQAVAAGATEWSPVRDEHGWRLGRIIDPFGHEWEIGAPLGTWP